jgi:transcriptional regulator with XRE-family HTH domain
MTPFGQRLRDQRAARGISQKEMAHALGVSAAYLSALEHGRRGQPAFALVERIIGYFNIIWDDADELRRLAALSHPASRVDTAGLSPQATEFANRLARSIRMLDQQALGELDQALRDNLQRLRQRR